MAILQVSPIQPATPVPSNKSSVESLVPSNNKLCKEVAPVITLSKIHAILGATKLFIIVVKEINATILPAAAGFTRFLPVPPNNILTTIIAKTLAINGMYKW